MSFIIKVEGKMKAKKYLIILILRILETNTDKDHPLTQVKITEMISPVFPCDRKTVGRNIKFLKEVGYPIEKTTKGFYMDKQLFSKEEVEYILASVDANSAAISEKEELCGRLRKAISRYYKR